MVTTHSYRLDECVLASSFPAPCFDAIAVPGLSIDALTCAAQDTSFPSVMGKPRVSARPSSSNSNQPTMSVNNPHSACTIGRKPESFNPPTHPRPQGSTNARRMDSSCGSWPETTFSIKTGRQDTNLHKSIPKDKRNYRGHNQDVNCG